MSQPNTQQSTYRLGLLVFWTLFLTYAYFYQSGEHNENARLDQLLAIVKEGRLSINNFVRNTADVVVLDGKTYPNKAPGGLLALPVFAVLYGLASYFFDASDYALHAVCYLTCVLSVGAVASYAGLLLLRLLLAAGLSQAWALALSLGWGLATIAFPYSTLFFSHQLTASLAVIVLSLLHFAQIPRQPPSGLELALAGLLCSFAFACEYPAALIGAGLFFYVLAQYGARALFIFCIGGLLGLVPFAAYNFAVFGNVFAVTYQVYAQQAQSPFPAHALGFSGVRMPDLQTLWRISFHPQRGLFWINPWLVALIPSVLLGLVQALSSRARKAVLELVKERLLCIWVILAFFAFNAGFGDSIVYWGGAHSIGPRHITPMLPFAVILIGLSVKWFWARWLVVGLMFPALAIMLMASAVEPRVPFGYAEPVSGFLWPFFSQGRFAIQIFGTFSNTLLTENSVAFNWGKLIGLKPQHQLLPLLVIWFVALGFLWRLLPLARWQRFAISALCALPFLAPLYFVPEVIPQASSQGLAAVYYSGEGWHDAQLRDPKGQVAEKSGTFTRIDPQIDFDWVRDGFPMQVAFCAEWRGWLLVPESGMYELATSSDDGSLLFIDDKLVIDNWGMHGFVEKRAQLELRQGPQPLLLRYRDHIMGGGVRLLWRKIVPGGENALRVIDKRYLRPQTTAQLTHKQN